MTETVSTTSDSTSVNGLNPSSLRTAFSHIPFAVVAIGADTGLERLVMAASTFVPVSLDPPLVSFCVQNESRTWRALGVLPHLGISVLTTAHDNAARTLASKHGDRFVDVTTTAHTNGALFIDGCELYLDATVDNEVAAGDHMIVVLRVNSLDCAGQAVKNHPLIFHGSRFRKLAL
ncbi:flavin reductase family protein [Nocardia fusca]|uniref:flavin reductase family protein n=1 Tax=Nocardia fusca TaxID=941183 RepID=UPI003F777FCC